MSKIPPYLKKGDTIGIVAPAGFMALDKMQTCIATLEDWGYKVQLGATTQSNSETYFSGTDDERLGDLQAMMDDRNIKAVLCARGGYGISRIIDSLNYRRLKKSPKWIIGYSDVTVLHAHLLSRYKLSSLHAPMAAAFNEGEAAYKYTQSIKAALEGMPAEYECAAHPFNQTGDVKGELVGGNLTLMAHLIGTESEFKTRGKILFLEDVGEYLYNIDRMFLQLKRAGKLKDLAGLIIGGFTDSKDTERPFGKTAYQVINDQLKEFKYPICFGFPVSHDVENYALKIGVQHRLQVTANGVILKEKI